MSDRQQTESATRNECEAVWEFDVDFDVTCPLAPHHAGPHQASVLGNATGEFEDIATITWRGPAPTYPPEPRCGAAFHGAPACTCPDVVARRAALAAWRDIWPAQTEQIEARAREAIQGVLDSDYLMRQDDRVADIIVATLANAGLLVQHYPPDMRGEAVTE